MRTTPARSIDVGVTAVQFGTGPVVFSGAFIANQRSSAVYLKWYDKATAPTQADTPGMTWPIPASTSGTFRVPECDFTLGCWARCTTAIADNSTAAPTANDCVVNAFVVKDPFAL